MLEEIKAKTNVNARYPIEYFSAPILFAWRISEVSENSFIEALEKYTGLKGELTGASFLDTPNDIVWLEFLNDITGKTMEEIISIAYSSYLKQSYATFDPDWVPPHSKRFGALGVDTHPWNLDRNQVKLHFLSSRKNGSDLASINLEERKKDMRALLTYVKTTHPVIENFTSFSWLQNLPNYRALFPEKFLARLEPMRDKFGGLWGQFVRWDGSANLENYNQFLKILRKASTLDEAIDVFPHKVLGAVGPIQEFYEMYEIR